MCRGVRRIEDKEMAAKRRKKPSAATRNQNKNEAGGGCEGNGMTGRGIFGRGMGNRPCRELFLCRTFLCRFFLNTFRPGKAFAKGMIVRRSCGCATFALFRGYSPGLARRPCGRFFSTLNLLEYIHLHSHLIVVLLCR